MTRPDRVRQAHRWLSMAFVVAFVANLVAARWEELVVWLRAAALLPLALLLATGLWLFVRPHALRWRRAARAGEDQAVPGRIA